MSFLAWNKRTDWLINGYWALDNHSCLTLSVDIARLFFGHLSRADPSQDHSHDLQSCILGPPRDWCRGVARPRQSWLRTVEDDLWPLNFSLATARRRALDRSAWRLVAATCGDGYVYLTCSREREGTVWWWRSMETGIKKAQARLGGI